MNENYTAVVEIRRRATALSDDDVDMIMAVLEHHAPAVGTSPRGWLELRITVPATSLAQATSSALALANVAASPFKVGESLIACQVMTEEESDARQGFVTIPTLLGTAEVAEILGVSPQRVRQLVDAGALQSTPVGKSLAFPRFAVEEFAARQRSSGRPVKRT